MTLKHTSKQQSCAEMIQMWQLKYPGANPYPFQSEERLGNPAIEFPIGIVYGDNDHFGSEGADVIIKNSKQFESGRSQLFKLEQATHTMNSDQPEKLVELCIGFFEGTIQGKFEEKPIEELAWEKNK